jgi:type I restriction enzyme M protein
VAASGWGPELIPEEDILQSQFPDVLAKVEQDRTRIAELDGLFAAADAMEEGEEPEESADGVLPKELVKTLKEERKELTGRVREIRKLVKTVRKDASDGEGVDCAERIDAIDTRLARYTELESELKTLKAGLKQMEKQQDELVAAARAKISDGDARQLIVERFQRLLIAEFDGYLRQYLRAFIAAVENLWEKYAVTAKQILAERDQAAAQLDAFLKELGYA